MSSTRTAPQVRHAPLVLHGLDGLRERAGSELGASAWRTVTQDMVSTFAGLTGDEQWIHVDPERATAGPFGTTIAHGFMTLGMSTGLLWEIAVVDRVRIVLNYGLDRVRFPAPVRVGSRVRMRASIGRIREVADGSLEVVYHLVHEVDGSAKPACVADLVFRYYAEEGPA